MINCCNLRKFSKTRKFFLQILQINFRSRSSFDEKKLKNLHFLLIAKLAFLKMKFFDLIIKNYKFHVNFNQRIVQTWSTIRTMSNKCQNFTFTWCALCMRSITMKISISITFRNSWIIVKFENHFIKKNEKKLWKLKWFL